MAPQQKPSGLTRRTFIVRSGAAVAVLYLPSTALAAQDAGLAEADAATYKALIEALAEAPGTGVVAAFADDKTRELSKAMETRTKDYRQNIGNILKAVEHGPKGAPFSELEPGQRLEFLRGWFYDVGTGRPEDAGDKQRYRTRGHRNRVYADSAIALVVDPFSRGDEHDPVPEVRI